MSACKASWSRDKAASVHTWISRTMPPPLSGCRSGQRRKIAAVSENGRMVEFKVSAWDEKGPIGSGVHTRAIIQNEKFLDRCNAKLENK